MNLTAVIPGILLCSTLALASDYSSWIYSRDITLNPTTAGGITATETNYPLLVRLTTAGGSGAGNFTFSQAAGNGSDIRFTASDNTTDLPYEIERWDSTGGAADIWVKVNSVNNTANTVIRMYWGKSGTTAASSGSTVFNSATNNFKAVFHFNNSIASSADFSLTPANNGTSDITTTTQIGGHALNLNTGTATTNTTNYIDMGTSSADTGFMNSSGSTTFGAWVYVTNFATASGSYGTLIAHGAGDNAEHFLRSTRSSSTATFWTAGVYNGTDYRDDFSVTNSAELNNWHYIVGTYAMSPSGGAIRLYRDGVAVGTVSNVPGAFTASLQNWVIGRYGATNSARYFSGYVDEARFANTIRDASWVKWDFETQKANQTAVTFGTTASLSAPGAPTAVLDTAGNAQVKVSWTAPSSNGGAAITGYTATSSPGNLTCITTGSLGCTVIGLTNGTAYTFTVTATNAVGTSPASAASAAVTPIAPPGVPGLPTAVTAVASNAQATISWTAPTSDGGSPITGYTATSSPDGKTCTTTGALTCTVTALTNGTSYTFTVVAANSSGPSAASAPTTAVTPVTVPAAPTSVLAAAGNAQVVVSWTASASTGGSAITGYKAMAVADTTKSCTTTGALTCTISGLTNGTAYTFVVKATNAVGTSVASTASATATPVTLPGAPTNVTGVGASGQVTVSWTAPASNGGSVITGYTVTAAQDTIMHCSTTGATTCTVTGLINTFAYTFTVVAKSAVGTGPASTPSSPVTSIFSLSKDLDFHVEGMSLSLRLPQNLGTAEVSMIDTWGRLAWKKTVEAGIRRVSLEDGHSLAPGVYILRVTTRDSRHKSSLAAESKILLAP